MTFSRRDFMRIAGVGILASYSFPAWAADDPFAEFEQMKREAFAEYNSMVRESFAELEQLTLRAYQDARSSIEQDWGLDETKLPEAKRWVGYDNASSGRVIVDYERQTIRVEAPAPTGAVPDQDAAFIEELGSRILEKDSRQQDAMDPVRTRLKRPAKPFSKPAIPEAATDVGRLILEKDSKKTKKALAQKIRDKGKVERRTTQTPTGMKEIVSVEVPFNPKAERLNAKVLKQPVDANSGRFKVPDELVFSVIENESSFNPRAISPIPAYGLMQLVPRTGGADAYEFVYGKQRIVDMEYLFNPLHNIELGAAYLHLLHYRYFRKLENPESRLYCSIAGYNTGPGNVSRAFTGTKKLSPLAAAVNSMTPRQVYERLESDLPYEETRRYLVKVTRSMKKYR